MISSIAVVWRDELKEERAAHYMEGQAPPQVEGDRWGDTDAVAQTEHMAAQTVNDLASLRGGSHDSTEVSETPILRNAMGSCGMVAEPSAATSANRPPRKRARPPPENAQVARAAEQVFKKIKTVYDNCNEDDLLKKPRLTLWDTAENKRGRFWQRQDPSNCSWTWFCSSPGLERLPLKHPAWRHSSVETRRLGRPARTRAPHPHQAQVVDAGCRRRHGKKGAVKKQNAPAPKPRPKAPVNRPPPPHEEAPLTRTMHHPLTLDLHRRGRPTSANNKMPKMEDVDTRSAPASGASSSTGAARVAAIDAAREDSDQQRRRFWRLLLNYADPGTGACTAKCMHHRRLQLAVSSSRTTRFPSARLSLWNSASLRRRKEPRRPTSASFGNGKKNGDVVT